MTACGYVTSNSCQAVILLERNDAIRQNISVKIGVTLRLKLGPEGIREREREKERERDRQTNRETDRQRETETETAKERERRESG